MDKCYLRILLTPGKFVLRYLIQFWRGFEYDCSYLKSINWWNWQNSSKVANTVILKPRTVSGETLAVYCYVCLCLSVRLDLLNYVDITSYYMFLYSVFKLIPCRGFGCACVQTGHVVLCKWPPLQWWPVINEWARESGSLDSWLGKEGIKSKRDGEKVEVCVARSVCLTARQDKARQRDVKSLWRDKEWAWEYEGKTKERATVRDCGSVSVEQYHDQGWRLFLVLPIFITPPFFLHYLKSPCSPAEIWPLLRLL